MRKILFISDRKYVNSEIRGGVQLCTHAYLDYLSSTGYEIRHFHVDPQFSFRTRIKVKLGLECYERYTLKTYLSELSDILKDPDIYVVCFNQVDLGFWAEKLRNRAAAHVKFVVMSHGNESGDYLHTLTRKAPAGLVRTWKLGHLLARENYLFRKLIDGVIVLSENELATDQWLGAEKLLFLPQLLLPDFIHWKPATSILGFAGTLDHLPNLLGIQLLAEALQQSAFTGCLEIIGGPAVIGDKLAERFSFIRYKGMLTEEQLKASACHWSIFLNPVFWYARGASTKLAQGINWGLPCLTTPAGSRGYVLSDERMVTASNTPVCFAQAILSELSKQNRNVSELKQCVETNALHFDKGEYVAKLTQFLAAL